MTAPAQSGRPTWLPAVLRSRRDGRAGARIDVGRSVPGWAVHVALAVVMVTGLGVATLGSEISPALIAIAAAGLVGGAVANLARPGYGVGGTALALILLPYVFGSPAGYTWRSPVLIVLVHAVVRLSWLATLAGRKTRVDATVLVQEGRRSAVFNLAGQVVALLAGALTAAADAAPSITWPWFAVLGGIAALLLALLLRHGLPTGHDAPRTRS